MEEPESYGVVRYTDIEVAFHTIQFENLPTYFSQEKMEKDLRQILEKIIMKSGILTKNNTENDYLVKNEIKSEA